MCAGLQSDRLRTTAVPADVRIIPFRGDYYSLLPAARHLVRGLIYPVPDPRFPFLGVHLTRRIDGEVWAGPNAVLAFAREGYRRRDVNLRDLADVVSYRGFWNLARRHWRTGVSEFWRDYRKAAFLAEIQRYVPRWGRRHHVRAERHPRPGPVAERATWSTTSCSIRRPR